LKRLAALPIGAGERVFLEAALKAREEGALRPPA
jgi:hypothetical protein